jgi:hypothetical protein
MSTYHGNGRSGARGRRMLAAAIVTGFGIAGAFLGAVPAAHAAGGSAAKIGLVTPDVSTPGTYLMRWTGKGSSYTCSVDGGTRVACGHPQAFTGLSQSQHTFAIFASGTQVASAVATPDAFDTQPADATVSTSATFAWHNPAGKVKSTQCSLDGASRVSCGSPDTINGLANGYHTFVVRIETGSSVSFLTRRWQVGSTTGPVAPTVQITDAPPSQTTRTSASISFDTTGSPDSTQCKLDDASYQTCASPAIYGGLAVGNHTFTVRVSNSAGSDTDSTSWEVTSTGSGTTRDVYPGGSIANAVNASSVGDTVVVHQGSYPTATLTHQFSAPVFIRAAAGDTVVVKGFIVSGGAGYDIQGFNTTGESRFENNAHDVTFSGNTCVIPPSDTNSTCAYVHDGSHDITITNNSLKGGWDGVKFYGCYGNPGWAHNVLVENNDISATNEDLIHVDCARDVLITHNYMHDVIDNSDHNDAIQSQASDGLQMIANTISYSTDHRFGPNQGIIVGRTDYPSDDQVTDTTIANNLIVHWPGIPLEVAGVNGLTIVNNTVWDDGEGSVDGLHIDNIGGVHGNFYANTNVQVWNNLLGTIWVDGQAPTYCANNIWVSYGQNWACNGPNNRQGVDPGFVDHSEYFLRATSPAIDAGTNRPGTPGEDIDGNARTSAPDLGAREE